MYLNKRARVFVPIEQYTTIGQACLKVLRHLNEKNLSQFIKAFRVTFTSFGRSLNPGPVIAVHFSDPLGNKCCHTTDFRFITKDEKPCPTADEIADHLILGKSYGDFPKLEDLIVVHLQRCSTEADLAKETLKWLRLVEKKN